MPRRSSPLDPDGGPLARMALDLRRLRDAAPAGRLLKVDAVADQEGVRTSRAAIYAALGAKRLVSREALTAMVKAWAPGGLEDLPRWMIRRRQCEDELASVETQAVESQSSPSDKIRPFGADLMTPMRLPKSELIRDQMRDLYEAAGRPPLRTLTQRAGNAVSHPTLHNALTGKVLPSQRTLRAFLTGVGADEKTSRFLISELSKINDETAPLFWQDGKLIDGDHDHFP